jgi:restriction endonuclease Mrr
MIIEGRNIIEPIVEAVNDGNNLRLRIDDKKIPAMWIQIEISQQELAQIITNGRMRGEATMGNSRIVLKHETETSEESDSGPNSGG